MEDFESSLCFPVWAILTYRRGCKTFWGGAPERGDLCLLEDGGKREGTLVSDLVNAETANEGQSRDAVMGESVSTRWLTE